MIKPYNIAVMQCNIRYLINPALKKEVISENLNRDLELIDGFMKFGGRPKIIQFPEFFLSGFWTGRTIKDWLEVSIQMPGEETDKLAQKAVEYNLYIAGNNYEVDPEWPGRYFNTSFMISPEGKIILKYRSLGVTASTFSTASSPPDFMDEYVAKYGDNALFPVADTPLGKLCVTSSILSPEVTRGFMFNGAEVMIACITAGPRFMAREVGRVRAWENMLWVGLGGAGKILGSPFTNTWSSGGAAIIDYKGTIRSQTETYDEAVIMAEVDVNQLRVERQRKVNNLVSIIRADVYAPMYEKYGGWTSNKWLGRPIQTTSEAEVVLKEVQEKLRQKGVLVPPE